MSQKHLATYLNDHLAGSVTALELLHSLEKAHPNSPLVAFLRELRTEIEEDRNELEGLMNRLGVSASVTRRAAAWVSEKVVELKLQVDDAADGQLRLLESFEAISLGIEGKRSLWKALEAASTNNTELVGPDYANLMQRAKDQRGRMESWRLEAACDALAETHGLHQQPALHSSIDEE